MKLFKSKTPDLPQFGIDDVAPLIKEVFGEIDPERISMFVPVKNEMPLLPAFLGHYRKMGFEQFLFFDDRSTDGTFDYLRAQEDCVVFHATMGFGEKLHYTGPTHKPVRDIRFGTYAKMAIPPHFFPGKIVAYFDADEFLLLPPGVSHIREVYDRIDALGSTGAYASVVEFFPASTQAFKDPLPQDFEGLMAAYGYFDAVPLFDPMAALDRRGKPVFTAPSKSMQMFEEFGIDLPIERHGLREKIYLSTKEKQAEKFNRSARHKTPILRRTEDSFLFSCHDAIQPPRGEILLTMAHFIFTANFAQKIENARKWKSHAQGGVKYRYYAALMDALEGRENGFLSDKSVRYEGPQQMIDCGLMKW